MSILVLGKTGQVARALEKTRPDSLGVEFLDRSAANFENSAGIRDAILRRKPRAVICAAAYTAVDLAETAQGEASQVNSLAVSTIAEVCRDLEIPLIHYSTDYVFPGTGNRPWIETDSVAPLSVYGQTKAEGESKIRETWNRHLIVRTSWVFAPEGKNFVRTMLRLGAERETLSVVNDQVGSPTSALEIARATWTMIATAQDSNFDQWGTYHLAAQGETNWHGFALAIFEEAKRLGFPLKVRDVRAISTNEYPTPAKRPLNSRLDCSKLARVFGIALPRWQLSLRECLEEIRSSGT